jgi:threonylcarbamoyladenosine tRNA methylthiotransferase MtaB
MKYAFYTLGCKVNQYETQAMQQLLLARGDTLGEFDGVCDCYIVNTCTVTAVSDKKSRNAIRRARKLNPNAVIGVCGCYAQTAPEEIRKLDVDVLIGTDGRAEFLDKMAAAVAEKLRWEHVEDAGLPRAFEQLPSGGLAERTRALLKVEDGCNNFCTYCIIPYARGRVRSLPLENAVAEARKLAAEGYREIVVNGIEISSWGWEWHDGSCLRQLLAALCAAVPSVRIRLGSLEPRTIDEEFCKTLSGFENLCPQFHLSLQSGSDSVLRRMHRKYDSARYLQSVELLHRYFPGCAVTTDLIVGFPGETEAEFEASLALIRRCALSKVHIFPYSRREGTPAAKMPDQVPKAVKEARASRAAAVAAELEDAFHTSLIGTEQPVLFEQPENGFYAGHAPNYAKVYTAPGELHNAVRRVRITELCRDGVFGVLTDTP